VGLAGYVEVEVAHIVVDNLDLVVLFEDMELVDHKEVD